VIDAQKHGVTVLAVDVNHSFWDNTLEGKFQELHQLRLGFRQVKGLLEEEINKLVAHRGAGYQRIEELAHVVSIPVLERLADADAFRSMGLDRRQALWEIAAVQDRPIALFRHQTPASASEGQISLPFMTQSEHVIRDYVSTGLSVKAHPVSFLRAKLDTLHVVPANKLNRVKNGMPVKVCGLITVRQRPGTAKGVLFVTIEDETGFTNLVVWSKIFSRYRREILQSRLLLVEGQIQVEKNVIHVVAKRCHNLNSWLSELED